MDGKFFDSLYEGDSANGVKLCMGVTGGDFWTRLTGCQNLYRGNSVETIDFNNILIAANTNELTIIIGGLIYHQAGEVYFYVLRRVNSYGDEEQTLGTALKTAFDDNGNLIWAVCNNVFNISAEQTAGPRCGLLWYYCPIGQEQAVDYFNIFSNNGSGGVDYNNPVAVVDYVGRGFYSYETGVLSNSSHLFCVRPVSSSGLEDGFFGIVEIDITDSAPQGIDIIQAQAY